MRRHPTNTPTTAPATTRPNHTRTVTAVTLVLVAAGAINLALSRNPTPGTHIPLADADLELLMSRHMPSLPDQSNEPANHPILDGAVGITFSTTALTAGWAPIHYSPTAGLDLINSNLYPRS